MPRKFIKYRISECLRGRCGNGSESVGALTQCDKGSKEPIRRWCLEGTSAISSVSQIKHLVAWDWRVQFLQGEKVGFQELKPLRPWLQTRILSCPPLGKDTELAFFLSFNQGLVSSRWHCLRRIKRCSLVGQSMKLGTGSEVSKATCLS